MLVVKFKINVSIRLRLFRFAKKAERVFCVVNADILLPTIVIKN